jgi:hypothetical protein
VDVLREADRHVGEERKEVKRVKGVNVTSRSGSDDKQDKITQHFESTEGDSYNARDASHFTLKMEAVPSYETSVIIY